MSNWIKTTDRLPAKPGNSSYEYVDCWIFVSGEVLKRAWDCKYKVWKSIKKGDFDLKGFKSTEPTHWQQFLPPVPPTD